MSGSAGARGWLDFGGYDLQRLALMAGQTPFFAYDRQAIADNVAKLRATFPDEISWFYSLKANPWAPVVHSISPLVDGLDVSSEGELRTALGTGVAPDRIELSGPGKSLAELRCAIAAGATISVESGVELARIAQIAHEVGRRADVMLRVNPDFELRGMGMRMGGVARQFGVDCEICPAVLAEMGTEVLRFRGLHIYWGSQCLKAETIIDAHRGCLAIVDKLARHFPRPPEILNFGGGFGIPYAIDDRPLDIESVGRAVEGWLPTLKSTYPNTEVVLELGRYLVGTAGIYVCRVVDKKVSRGETFLVTDGGMHHQLAASGNLGQVVRRNYPIVIGNRVNAEPSEKVNISGCLCTPIDVLANKVTVAPAVIGDYVVVRQSGAYGKSSSPVDFLGHPHPPEILV